MCGPCPAEFQKKVLKFSTAVADVYRVIISMVPVIISMVPVIPASNSSTYEGSSLASNKTPSVLKY